MLGGAKVDDKLKHIEHWLKHIGHFELEHHAPTTA